MDLTYTFEKLYNGTFKSSTHPDKAALAKVHVPEVRERLGELKSKLVEKGTKLNGHESAIAQAEQHLTALEGYYDSIEKGNKKPPTDVAARKLVDFVRDEITALAKLV